MKNICIRARMMSQPSQACVPSKLSPFFPFPFTSLTEAIQTVAFHTAAPEHLTSQS